MVILYGLNHGNFPLNHHLGEYVFSMFVHASKKQIQEKGKLGGGFKYFFFSTLVGEDSHFD